MKCVVRKDGKFLTPRRATGHQYVSRTEWSDDIEDAKVFQTKGSATNSARSNLGNDGVFQVVGVEMKIMGVL